MKMNRFWMGSVAVVGLVAAIGQMAFAANGGATSGGGDTCLKSVPIIRAAMLDSVIAQGQQTFPEFDLATLKFFIKRAEITVVPNTVDENGQETDATSFPGPKQIHLSRKRWCGQTDADKAAILFHEFMVVMEIESTGVYSVSSKFQFIEAQKKWECTVNTYQSGCLTEGLCENINQIGLATGASATPTGALMQSGDQLDKYNSKQVEICEGRYPSRNGDEYQARWYKECVDTNTRIPCYKIESNGKRYFCSEKPTVANSCIQK